MNELYKNKYLKYKNKYHNFKKNKMRGGNLYLAGSVISSVTLISLLIYFLHKKFSNKESETKTYISTYENNTNKNENPVESFDPGSGISSVISVIEEDPKIRSDIEKLMVGLNKLIQQSSSSSQIGNIKKIKKQIEELKKKEKEGQQKAKKKKKKNSEKKKKEYKLK